MQQVKYWLMLPVRIVKWFFHEKPWLWRPGIETDTDKTFWTFGIVPYIDWSDDGLMDFDRLGVALLFGPWFVTLYLEDND